MVANPATRKSIKNCEYCGKSQAEDIFYSPIVASCGGVFLCLFEKSPLQRGLARLRRARGSVKTKIPRIPKKLNSKNIA